MTGKARQVCGKLSNREAVRMKCLKTITRKEQKHPPPPHVLKYDMQKKNHTTPLKKTGTTTVQGRKGQGNKLYDSLPLRSKNAT